MQVLERKNKPAVPTPLRGLRKYTASQAAAINAYSRLFERASSWEKWIEDTLQNLLEVPSGLKLQISQSNELHGEQTREFVFEQKEISIGRAAENDIALSLNSISRRHAHIVERGGAYHIEDLDSASGTYVNRTKLEPTHPRRLVSGDEVLIFPYVFRINPQELWARDEEVELSYSCRFVRTAASEFASSFGSDMCVFRLGVHPDMGHALLAMTRPFLKTILSRLTRDSISEFAITDLGLFEFVVISILERANRELRFPFQCVLEPGKDAALQNEPGIALNAAARLAKAQGSIQVFLPDSCLRKLQGTTVAELPAKVREHLTWRVVVCLGFVELTAADLADLELADTLIYTSEVAMILPAGAASQAPERGWQMVRDDDNPRRFEVKEFFERSILMADSTDLQDEGGETGKDEGGVTSKVELAALPVRIQVVLSQVELSLKDLEGLTEGSIIELDEENTGSVQLATNGKIVGAGDLVEVDDRLGVQITHWRKD
jgi:type III secretion system YscQ/HrcQ family protein